MVKQIGRNLGSVLATAKNLRTAKREARMLAEASAALAVSPAEVTDEATALPVTRRVSREATPCRTLRVYFIKPSKYDEQGYVLYFWKGVLPNNTLTALAALNEGFPPRQQQW